MCGCGGSDFDWEEFERRLEEELEEAEREEEAIEVTEEFAIPVRISEEVEH